MTVDTARRIALLPDAVANQIAAGEVVERPASVVKELVENALDAGATEVRITAANGGKTNIEVADNGIGMSRDDAIMAFDRHATSKIRNSEDLVGISSFGFRGEALPAVASVTRLELITALTDGEGTSIRVAGGRIDSVNDLARRRGTTVVAGAIFFNTPARRRFLRSATSESRAIRNVVSTIALAHPEVGFNLILDARLVLDVPAGQRRDERLAAVWGEEVARTLIPVGYGVGPVRVEGYVQRPADARPTGRKVQLFVNGRPFRDHFLVRAAESGYRTAIHPGDRPSIFLNFEVAPELVDVNVHPAKLEVRFRDRYAVERAAEEAVRHSLGELVSSALVGSGPLPGAPPPPRRESSSSPDGEQPGDLFAPLDTGEDDPDVVESSPPHRGWRVPLLQLADSYVCYESPEGLVIVDQHAAHERILYEEAMASLDADGMPGQRMLLPETIELTDEELEAAADHADLLSRLGYEAEPFGGRAMVLHAAPQPHPRFDAIASFRELVADLARGRFGGWANRIERFCQSWACRSAIKAGQPLDEAAMRQLLERLFDCDLPPHDVHGRATIVQLPREELERRFGRR